MQKSNHGSTIAPILRSALLLALMLTTAVATAQGPEKLYLVGKYNGKQWATPPSDDTPAFETTDRTVYTLEIAITSGLDQWNPTPFLNLYDSDGAEYGIWGESSNNAITLFKNKNGTFTLSTGYKYRLKAEYTQVENPYNSTLLETAFVITVENLGSTGGGGDEPEANDGTHKSIKLDYTYNHLPKRKLAITPDTEIKFDGNYMYVTNSTGRYMNSLNNLGGFSISSDPGTQLSEITTGIVTPVSESLRVLNTGSAVEITGAAANTEIYLFTISGVPVASARQTDMENATILTTGTLTPGIYVLTVGEKSFKLAIR